MEYLCEDLYQVRHARVTKVHLSNIPCFGYHRMVGWSLVGLKKDYNS